jgi:hypothetical protein
MPPSIPVCPGLSNDQSTHRLVLEPTLGREYGGSITSLLYGGTVSPFEFEILG